MELNTSQVDKLLKGNHTLSQLGFSMLVTRFKKEYTANPSPSTLNKAADEINAFVRKYRSVIGKDLAVISKL